MTHVCETLHQANNEMQDRQTLRITRKQNIIHTHTKQCNQIPNIEQPMGGQLQYFAKLPVRFDSTPCALTGLRDL